MAPWEHIQRFFLMMELGRAKPAQGLCSFNRCTEHPVQIYFWQPGRWFTFPTARCEHHLLADQ